MTLANCNMSFLIARPYVPGTPELQPFELTSARQHWQGHNWFRRQCFSNVVDRSPPPGPTQDVTQRSRHPPRSPAGSCPQCERWKSGSLLPQCASASSHPHQPLSSTKWTSQESEQMLAAPAAHSDRKTNATKAPTSNTETEYANFRLQYTANV